MANASLIISPLNYASGLTPTGFELSTSAALANLGDRFPDNRWIPALGTSAEPFIGSSLVKSTIGLPLGEPRSIGSVFLGNLNSTSAAKCRVRMNATAIPARERLAPTSLVSSSFFSGAVGDVDDDPEAADGNFMETTSDAAAVALFAMANPASNPTNNPTTANDTGLQVVRCRVTAPTEGASTVTVKVFDFTTEKTTAISSAVVPANQTIILHGTWDAADLDTFSGANVRLEVTITGGQTTDGDTRLEAIDWLSLNSSAEATYEGPFREIVPAAMAGATLDDASLVDTTLTKNFHEPVNLAEAVGGSLPIVYAAVAGMQFLEIELLDPLNPGPQPLGTETDGHNTAGILWAGPAIYLGDGSSGPVHGDARGQKPADPDTATRLLGIPLKQISETNMTELLAYGFGQSRDPQMVVHMRPGLADAERSSHHLPMYMVPSGSISMTELFLSGPDRSVSSGNLDLREYLGDRRED